MSRRRFLQRSAFFCAGLTLFPASLATATSEKPAALDSDLVFEFVRAGHNDLPRVREVLAAEPGLLNASWDWGGGDFETALGGASHVGNEDIARFLIGRGARLDLFAATMLGMLDVVRPLLTRQPQLALSKGPHGLDLLHHAERGGEQQMIELVRTAMTLDAADPE